MAQLAIKGHKTRGDEVIKILEMLGGNNKYHINITEYNLLYTIREGDDVIIGTYHNSNISKIFTLEEFLEKFPYKVGDRVRLVDYESEVRINRMIWDGYDIKYGIFTDEEEWYSAKQLNKFNEPYKEEVVEDKGNISDGYHTFNELYEYRLLYNASMFNELSKQGLYDVHKSKLHSDGTIPFDDENWFIVQAELPTGQISNHYEIKDWNLFQVPVKEKANPYDGHSPQDVAKRLREFLTPKYPKTYEECCDVLHYDKSFYVDTHLYSDLLGILYKLLICRDAYWKIAGDWKPNFTNQEAKFIIANYYGKVYPAVATNYNRVLIFPTEEIRDVFYENFKDLIEECKELL